MYVPSCSGIAPQEEHQPGPKSDRCVGGEHGEPRPGRELVGAGNPDGGPDLAPALNGIHLSRTACHAPGRNASRMSVRSRTEIAAMMAPAVYRPNGLGSGQFHDRGRIAQVGTLGRTTVMRLTP
jgi:hypothetical protein